MNSILKYFNKTLGVKQVIWPCLQSKNPGAAVPFESPVPGSGSGSSFGLGSGLGYGTSSGTSSSSLESNLSEVSDSNLNTCSSLQKLLIIEPILKDSAEKILFDKMIQALKNEFAKEKTDFDTDKNIVLISIKEFSWNHPKMPDAYMEALISHHILYFESPFINLEEEHLDSEKKSLSKISILTTDIFQKTLENKLPEVRITGLRPLNLIQTDAQIKRTTWETMKNLITKFK